LRPYSRTASCQSHRFASASLVPTTSPGCGGHTRAAALTGQVGSIVERTEYEKGTATGWRMSTPRGRPLSSPCWRRRRRTTDRARPGHASRSRGFELCSSTLRVDALHRLGFGDQRLRRRGLHSPVEGSRLIRGTATGLAGEPKLTCHPARSPVPTFDGEDAFAQAPRLAAADSLRSGSGYSEAAHGRATRPPVGAS
jgi:hypothetical protein